MPQDMSLTEISDQVFLPGGATELKIWDLAPTLLGSISWNPVTDFLMTVLCHGRDPLTI